MTNGGDNALKWHAWLASFEDKGKIQKLRFPVAGGGNLFGNLKQPESPEVTNDSLRKKNNSTFNNQPTQLLISAF